MMDQGVSHTESGEQEATGGLREWFDPDATTFGDRFAGAREASGLSRSDLATRVGVEEATVALWEEDHAEPSTDRLQALAGLLNVSMTWLLNAQGDGLDGPAGEAPVPVTLQDILEELRTLKFELNDLTGRIGSLETKLHSLAQREASGGDA